MTPIKNINNNSVNNSHINNRNNSATPNTGNYNNVRLIQLDPARVHKYGKKDQLEPNTT